MGAVIVEGIFVSDGVRSHGCAKDQRPSRTIRPHKVIDSDGACWATDLEGATESQETQMQTRFLLAAREEKIADKIDSPREERSAYLRVPANG